ncbi:transglutaminase domain-containing protein [Brucella intermedia LMG 3301]|uniref:Transglutaminase domain-containing protein n=1 Tax=Brucella intermedia LMG 3301 TaxID=641118 RepID=C4WLL9_9HYPH|nr:transglutaminase domain-containing protein [Brucella intermedia LMG 3301]
MNRRELLKSGAACAAVSMLPNFASAASTAFAPQPSDWRSFEITTSVTPAASGRSHSCLGAAGGLQRR